MRYNQRLRATTTTYSMMHRTKLNNRTTPSKDSDTIITVSPLSAATPVADPSASTRASTCDMGRRIAELVDRGRAIWENHPVPTVGHWAVHTPQSPTPQLNAATENTLSPTLHLKYFCLWP